MQPDPMYTREHLYVALQQSLQLLSHYATQLNCYDGGSRKEDLTPGTWLNRLVEIGTIKIDGKDKKATA